MKTTQIARRTKRERALRGGLARECEKLKKRIQSIMGTASGLQQCKEAKLQPKMDS